MRPLNTSRRVWDALLSHLGEYVALERVGSQPYTLTGTISRISYPDGQTVLLVDNVAIVAQSAVWPLTDTRFEGYHYILRVYPQ